MAVRNQIEANANREANRERITELAAQRCQLEHSLMFAKTREEYASLSNELQPVAEELHTLIRLTDLN